VRHRRFVALLDRPLEVVVAAPGHLGDATRATRRHVWAGQAPVRLRGRSP
jgi:hypothetical protein